MCFTLSAKSKLIPKIAGKPILVYKTTTPSQRAANRFVSYWHDFYYYVGRINRSIKLIPKPIYSIERSLRRYEIYKGYHSFPTKRLNVDWAQIGIFEIPQGATYFKNMLSREIVSSDIIYRGPCSRELELELLKTHIKFKG
jgi:hypothetical protein